MALLDAVALAVDPEGGTEAEAIALNARYGGLDAGDAIAVAVNDLYAGRIALVSSFGAESAVLLHLLSEVDRSTPVVFLDTGRLFAETLEYRSALVAHLALTDVRSVTPDPARVFAKDPHRALWMTDPDVCCRIRKTEPLARALTGFDAWFTGRKRFQSATRAGLRLFEADGERIKINPLANWGADDLTSYMERHDLPAHPLATRGYPSIGCEPCTSRVAPGEDTRAGRWRGFEKTECGIHTGLEADGSGI
jgi:phosphoadenosine phosphosulfate reductase